MLKFFTSQQGSAIPITPIREAVGHDNRPRCIDVKGPGDISPEPSASEIFDRG
ncbi:MAG TPA: hypothetical protein VN326_15675 [Casimicrobiaceae bacterium]|jgi:hypothetical protein|nr:hypothetical protein [Casimicrobiaceae bacterium]